MLLHAGKEAMEVYRAFVLAVDRDKDKFDKVLEAFEQFYIFQKHIYYMNGMNSGVCTRRKAKNRCLHDKAAVHRLLGMINYLDPHIPNMASICARCMMLSRMMFTSSGAH